MWIITTIGFFSIVKKTGDDFLTVRARSPQDLDRLRKQYLPELSETLLHKGTDYPVRATITANAFAEGLARLGQDINYPNFKDEVARKMGKARAGVYSQVWSCLHAIEQEGEKAT